MFEYGSAGPMGREVMERTGAILAGRRGFDLGIRAGAGPRAIYGGAWSGPVFVLTHRPGGWYRRYQPEQAPVAASGIVRNERQVRRRMHLLTARQRAGHHIRRTPVRRHSPPAGRPLAPIRAR